MPNSKRSRSEIMSWWVDAYLDNTPDFIFVKDLDLNYLAASRRFAEMVGYKCGRELVGKTDHEIFADSALADRYVEDDRQVLVSGQPMIDSVEPIPSGDGHRRYSSTSKYIIYDPQGEPVALYGVGRDVSAEIELNEEKERRKLSNCMFDAIVEADITGNRVLNAESESWPAIIRRLRARSYDGLLANVVKLLVGKDYRQHFEQRFSRKHLEQTYHDGTVNYTHTIQLGTEGCERLWVEISIRMYRARMDNALRLTAFIKNVDDEVISRKELQRRAGTDQLTGMLNRLSALERIKDCLSGAGFALQHALLFIDLDGFKQINDTLGHPFGDRVLRDVAERLRALSAPEDIICRLGGDEFIMFIPNCDTDDAAARMAEQIIQALRLSYHGGDTEVVITCSIGIAMYRGGGKPVETLYSEADKAMYVAKRSGKAQYSFYV